MINLSYLFSQDTLETKTFFLNTAEDSYAVEISCPLVQECLDLIKAKIANMSPEDVRYIKVPESLNLEVCGEKVIEILWD